MHDSVQGLDSKLSKKSGKLISSCCKTMTKSFALQTLAVATSTTQGQFTLTSNLTNLISERSCDVTKHYSLDQPCVGMSLVIAGK
jgi:hypothetical protein